MTATFVYLHPQLILWCPTLVWELGNVYCWRLCKNISWMRLVIIEFLYLNAMCIGTSSCTLRMLGVWRVNILFLFETLVTYGPRSDFSIGPITAAQTICDCVWIETACQVNALFALAKDILLIDFAFVDHRRGVLSRATLIIQVTTRGDCARIRRRLQLGKLRLMSFSIFQCGSSVEAPRLHVGYPH